MLAAVPDTPKTTLNAMVIFSLRLGRPPVLSINAVVDDCVVLRLPVAVVDCEAKVVVIDARLLREL